MALTEAKEGDGENSAWEGGRKTVSAVLFGGAMGWRRRPRRGQCMAGGDRGSACVYGRAGEFTVSAHWVQKG